MGDPWHDQRPMAPVAQAPPPQRRGNSPFALVAVFGMVLLGVLGVAVVGKVASGGSWGAVPGVPLAEGERPDAGGALAEITANPLLDPGARLSPVECALPELSTDAEGLESFYRAGIACLDRAWEPVLSAAGKPFRPPGLTIDDRPRGRCGASPDEEEAIAFYCERDGVIAMPRTRLAQDAGPDVAIHLAVLAHEYGHHVQALSGILGAAGRREEAAGEAEALELSRRVELQANCFAGVFLSAVEGRGSVDGELAAEAAESFVYVDDSDSHGSTENQYEWAMSGYIGESTDDCDTWSAAPGEVE